jgi:hypothetical protein
MIQITDGLGLIQFQPSWSGLFLEIPKIICLWVALIGFQT